MSLCIFLCVMLTNYNGEKSFSMMKMIKNYFRTTMLEERLTYLAIISIEANVLNNYIRFCHEKNQEKNSQL